MGKGSKAFTLVEMMVVALIIAGLLVVMVRIYKINSDYETAHQIDEFVRAVDKGLFIANISLQNSSFRDRNISGNEGDNGGLYLIVSDISFNSVYNALMKGDCMIRCFDNDDNNNENCGNPTLFNGMCQSNASLYTLCLINSFNKKYLDTYMIPIAIQGKISSDYQVVNPNYLLVKEARSGSTISIGQLVKLRSITIDLSDNPSVINILQNIGNNKYQRSGNRITYLLNNGAGHFVIVRNGYVCQ